MANAPAVVVRTRAELAERIAQWPDQDPTLGTSWALTFLNPIPSASDLRAIREAAKICDRVAALRLTPDKLVPPGIAERVGDAGADVLWLPTDLLGKARLTGIAELPDVPATLLLQGLLAILPNVIVIPRGEVLWHSALQILTGTIGEMAPLHLIG